MVFKVANSSFQLGNCLAHHLGPRLPLAIVVFAVLCLLGANTLLAGRFGTITALQIDESAAHDEVNY